MIICLTTITQFEPFVFPMLGFIFAYVSDIYIIMSLYDFCLLPTYFCYVIINVRNLETSDEKCGLVCALVGYQWCKGLHFTGATILTDGYLLQTPKWDRHKSFWTTLMLYKGLVLT
jgi:hypothetical protein